MNIQDQFAMDADGRRETARLQAEKRVADLEAALHKALAAMSVAQAIDAVRAEYDFEPAIRECATALRRE